MISVHSCKLSNIDGVLFQTVHSMVRMNWQPAQDGLAQILQLLKVKRGGWGVNLRGRVGFLKLERIAKGLGS